MESIVGVIKGDLEAIDSILSRKDAVREEAYRLVRELTRSSGDIIVLVHRGMGREAGSRLEAARSLVRRLNELLREHPDIYYTGMVYNGLSEYAEAELFYGITVEGKAPSWRELEIPYVPYLQGLGDLVGELRRYVVELLDKGLIDEARKYFNVMEEVYINLRRLDYPDALTPGLRHKVDVASRLVEDTRILILATRNAYAGASLAGRETGEGVEHR